MVAGSVAHFVSKNKVVTAYVTLIVVLLGLMLFLELNLPSESKNYTSPYPRATITKVATSNAKRVFVGETETVAAKAVARSYDSIVIYCMVPTLWPENKARLELIANTWAPLCDRLFWVIDSRSTDDSLPANGLFHGRPFLQLNLTLEQSKATRNIWEKMWKTWYWLGSNTSALSDGHWFLKVDDDSFFSPLQFKGFAQFFDPTKPHWLGHTLMHKWIRDNTIFNSGACYALSRGAIVALRSVFEEKHFRQPPQSIAKEIGVYCVERMGALEDQSLGVCLRSLGVPPTNTVDNYGRQRFHMFKASDMGKVVREDTWFWAHKRQSVAVGPSDCCSQNSIAFHGYKQANLWEIQPLHAKYNNLTKWPNLDSPLFEKPTDTGPFQYDSESITFQMDEFGNKLPPPRGQRIYKGENRSRFCWDCPT